MTPQAQACTGARRPCRTRAHLAAPLLALAAAACDIPTIDNLPILEQRWIVPAEETRFGVAELLPADVALTADSSAFVVDFDPITFSQSLADLCPACTLADGFTVPKPAFVGSTASNVAFPAEVTSFTLEGGSAVLEVENGFNFDPLRPAAGAYGSLTLTVTDAADGEVLGMVVVEGESVAFPPGSTLSRTLDLAPATVEGPIEAEATLDSPLGDPVTVDSSLDVTVTATPTNILVSAVTIDVASEAVTLDAVDLETEDLDGSIVENVVDGAVLLEVTNPFGVTADFDLTVTVDGAPVVQKSASIPAAPSSTVEIPFTGEELQRFLGKPNVQVTGGGVVDPAAGAITVAPGQVLRLEASFDVTFRLGD
ncbi:MAG TPA: hypothetical protein VFQ22_14120 [Longimicrobiales bacterium]|nr:hypothetical protein [Longimicrobiales bacterium]